jgi:hypothetical protein
MNLYQMRQGFYRRIIHALRRTAMDENNGYFTRDR